ncbi:MAG: hypothetical protein AMJ72_05350 [Acidithiobacillales bacterium SM1_46]|nr:MAG: hypothetical protein AMJ72_05350 [Acidithiobacillales bacterium SM1_46]
MRYLITLLALVPLFAHAAPVTLEWDWPTEYCPANGQQVGDPLDIADIQSAEIYISEQTIPRQPGTCTADPDVPPTSAIIQTVSTPDTTVTIDLQCGKTYFFVMRVQAQGQWSNFSAEATRILDCARPNVPVIIRLT